MPSTNHGNAALTSFAASATLPVWLTVTGVILRNFLICQCLRALHIHAKLAYRQSILYSCPSSACFYQSYYDRLEPTWTSACLAEKIQESLSEGKLLEISGP
ncbi:unnamed protein product [Pipistrellus nathusii]|uniref:Uncharacterized protein n=1 Tax=Pipistrellus nathusii TaxID=59473 RepID=A0ABN9Z5E2_PIPNA